MGLYHDLVTGQIIQDNRQMDMINRDRYVRHEVLDIEKSDRCKEVDKEFVLFRELVDYVYDLNVAALGRTLKAGYQETWEVLLCGTKENPVPDMPDFPVLIVKHETIQEIEVFEFRLEPEHHIREESLINLSKPSWK